MLKLDGKKVTHSFKKNRLGFLFIASGEVNANGQILETGDSVRMKNLDCLELLGKGEAVMWELAEA